MSKKPPFFSGFMVKTADLARVIGCFKGGFGRNVRNVQKCLNFMTFLDIPDPLFGLMAL